MGAGNKKTGFETRVEVFKRAHDPTRNIDIDILAFKVTGGAEELARALTCQESDIYHRHAPSELVKSTEKNPHELMKEMTSWSNALSLFVVNSVMGHGRATSRAEVVELLIEVAVVSATQDWLNRLLTKSRFRSANDCATIHLHYLFCWA